MLFFNNIFSVVLHNPVNNNDMKNSVTLKLHLLVFKVPNKKLRKKKRWNNHQTNRQKIHSFVACINKDVFVESNTIIWKNLRTGIKLLIKIKIQ